MSLPLAMRAHANKEAWEEATRRGPDTVRLLALQVATSGEWWPGPPEAIRWTKLCRQTAAFALPRVRYCLAAAAAREQQGGSSVELGSGRRS